MEPSYAGMVNEASSRTEKTVRTRICIISDTHTAKPRPAESTDHAYRDPLPTADILLHAGDITFLGDRKEYGIMLDVLKAAPAELKLVIAGNHDVTLDREYFIRQRGGGKECLKELDDAKEMWTGEEARKAGIIYLEEGTNTIECRNGARLTVYSSPYQPEFCDWAFPYKRGEDRFNAGGTAANPVPDFPHIDLMLTHGPPMGILDETTRGEHVGCEHLWRADQRCRPLIHCFGHIHEGWGAVRIDWARGAHDSVVCDQEQVLKDRSARVDLSSVAERPLEFGKETLFVNAAIMDVRYSPRNAPWVVDVDLPVRDRPE